MTCSIFQPETFNATHSLPTHLLILLALSTSNSKVTLFYSIWFSTFTIFVLNSFAQDALSTVYVTLPNSLHYRNTTSTNYSPPIHQAYRRSS